MKIMELMELANIHQTGIGIDYIKDGLREIELYTEENVHTGTRSYMKGNTISFGMKTLNTDNNPTFEGHGSSNSTPPTGWTIWEQDTGVTDPTFINSSGDMMIVFPNNLSSSQMQGIYSPAMDLSAYAGTTVIVRVKAPSSSIAGGNSVKVKYGLADGVATSFNTLTNSNSLWTREVTYGDGADDDCDDFQVAVDLPSDTAECDNLRLYLMAHTTGAINQAVIFESMTIEASSIYNSQYDFSNFSDNQKIRINGSTSNDTDKSSNTSTGYYTSVFKDPVSSNYLIFNASGTSQSVGTHFFTEESAGELIEVIGINRSLKDIVKNKRYYTLPSDLISLKKVMIKNHKNGDDKFRVVERTVNPPLTHDSDNI